MSSGDPASPAIRLPPTCRWRLERPTLEQHRQHDTSACCIDWARGGSAIEAPLCLEMDLADEVYRFSWLSSFDGDLMVKVTRTAAGCTAQVERQWIVPPYATERTLSPSEWLHIEAAISVAAFWSLPGDASMIGFDGADWSFEGRKADVFHSVRRWSPTDPALRALGKVFAECAGFPDLNLY